MNTESTPGALRLNDQSGPMPEPFETERYFSGPHERTFNLYTETQMLAYAAQEVAAERERCAKLCDDLFPRLPSDTERNLCAWLAQAIRRD